MLLIALAMPTGLALAADAVGSKLPAERYRVAISNTVKRFFSGIQRLSSILHRCRTWNAMGSDNEAT